MADVVTNMTLMMKRPKTEVIVICFEAVDERWLYFICDDRSSKPTGEYDIVIKPVKDDETINKNLTEGKTNGTLLNIIFGNRIFIGERLVQ